MLRHAVTRYALILLLGLAFSLPPDHPLPLPTPGLAGRLERADDVPILYLQGEPYQMGVQQGVALQSELRHLIEVYVYDRLVLDLGVSHLLLLEYARVVDAAIPNDLRLEIRGIADGAGLSYDDILILNTIPDLLALTGRLPSWDLFPTLFRATSSQQTAPSPSLCTTFAGWGSDTADGELVLGHHLDYTEGYLGRFLLLVVRQPDNGNAFVAQSLMGTVSAWAGMNEEKVAVTVSSSPSVDRAHTGQPLPFVLREVLQTAGDISEATNTLLSANRLCGGNVFLVDGKAPEGVVIELSSHRQAVFEVEGQGGLQARANHFLDPELALTQAGALSAQEKAASQARLQTLLGWLEVNRGWIGVEKALAFTSQTPGAPQIARQDPDGLLYVGHVTQRIVFYPGKLTMWIRVDEGAEDADASYQKLDLSASLLGRY